MTTTAQQVRAWKGPAVLSFGFRPFFLGGALWAAISMVLLFVRAREQVGDTDHAGAIEVRARAGPQASA